MNIPNCIDNKGWNLPINFRFDSLNKNNKTNMKQYPSPISLIQQQQIKTPFGNNSSKSQKSKNMERGDTLTTQPFQQINRGSNTNTINGFINSNSNLQNQRQKILPKTITFSYIAQPSSNTSREALQIEKLISIEPIQRENPNYINTLINRNKQVQQSIIIDHHQNKNRINIFHDRKISKNSKGSFIKGNIPKQRLKIFSNDKLKKSKMSMENYNQIAQIQQPKDNLKMNSEPSKKSIFGSYTVNKFQLKQLQRQSQFKSECQKLNIKVPKIWYFGPLTNYVQQNQKAQSSQRPIQLKIPIIPNQRVKSMQISSIIQKLQMNSRYYDQAIDHDQYNIAINYQDQKDQQSQLIKKISINSENIQSYNIFPNLMNSQRNTPRNQRLSISPKNQKIDDQIIDATATVFPNIPTFQNKRFEKNALQLIQDKSYLAFESDSPNKHSYYNQKINLEIQQNKRLEKKQSQQIINEQQYSFENYYLSKIVITITIFLFIIHTIL